MQPGIESPGAVQGSATAGETGEMKAVPVEGAGARQRRQGRDKTCMAGRTYRGNAEPEPEASPPNSQVVRYPR